MLFNSYEFVFLFLPMTLAGYLLVGRKWGTESAFRWLVIASLFFYGWWNPNYLLLILFSMVFNFFIGEAIAGKFRSGLECHGKAFLIFGVVVNLALLGYFKYANFFVDNLKDWAGLEISLHTIVLPLAISFFTFQQIAYLVDVWQKKAQEYSFVHYALFVTFFPQLIAGPIVHHAEMLPQFQRRTCFRVSAANLAVGSTIFLIGLCKKTVLADGIAPYANQTFGAAASGDPMTFFIAWGGALAYTMQLYFDFSGYSDMAIGAARMFGIRLPINFHSPYKATSISEFWRRWHMTLSRFLRDYLYIPLGGNRSGGLLRYRNLMLTMLLGGLWHGAGWTFVFWGGLHGAYLVLNHGWRQLIGLFGWGPAKSGSVSRAFAWLFTFIAVVVSWVFFRAESFYSAIVMLQGMAGLNGISLPNAIGVRLGELGELLSAAGVDFYLGGGGEFMAMWAWVFGLLAVALSMPNTQEIMGNFKPGLVRYASNRPSFIEPLEMLAVRLRWSPTVAWSFAVSIVALLAVLGMSQVSEFLYFQF